MDDQDIQIQLDRLSTYRRTLSLLINQFVMFGPANCPQHIIHGLIEAKENIRKLKAVLDNHAIPYSIFPDDEFTLRITNSIISSSTSRAKSPDENLQQRIRVVSEVQSRLDSLTRHVENQAFTSNTHLAAELKMVRAQVEQIHDELALQGANIDYALLEDLLMTDGEREGDRHRIVVVDDEINILHLVQHTLERADYKVFLANDGIEGIQLATKVHPALVLLDITMPVFDGYHVINEIRARKIPTHVIMLTASSNTDTVVDFIKLGACDYIVKPFQPSILLQKVRKAIETGITIDIISGEKEQVIQNLLNQINILKQVLSDITDENNQQRGSSFFKVLRKMLNR